MTRPDAPYDRPRADTTLAFHAGTGGARIEGTDGALHYLNQTAATVWLLADGSRDLPEIATELANLFHLPEPPTGDVAEAVSALRGKGLLYPSEG